MLPDVAESTEALEFIGFTPKVAHEIFQRYVSRPDPKQNPYDLLAYAYGHVGQLKSLRFRDLTTQEALTRVGLTTKQQEPFLDPKFSHILWTESLYFWVEDTLRTNYTALLRLKQRGKNQARRGRKAKRTSLHGVFSGPGSTTTATASGIQLPQVTASVNMYPEDYNLPVSHIALESEGPLLQDHLVLYKGRSPEDMLSSVWIQEDGSLNMNAMATRGNGDFNHLLPAWYWTPEKDVAEQYRVWAEARSPWCETWLIRIQIPKSYIAPLNRADLWFSDDWKEYVWHCRSGQEPPAKYDDYWKPGKADIVQGPICTGKSKEITRIKKEDIQTHITVEHLIKSKVTGRKATQYVFMQSGSAMRLGEVIRGKIHIEITGSLANRQSSMPK